MKLATFVAWANDHIKGDEKGEAQIFLDRLFKAFGHDGLKEAGATCEKRVKNDGGGTSFADLVWKPVVLIEMKKRGVDLSKHYRQAFDYWAYLVPNRPRYAILCNFDEFWVYDFETQLDTPVDKVSLNDLPTKYGPLNFLFPGDEKPVFGNHQETVTRQAADKLATCFNLIVARGVDRALAQRFVLQMLMALFAQDIGLIERYFVTRVLADCSDTQSTYDLLGGLFEAMNKPKNSGGRFKAIPYFNGGLFAQPAQLELEPNEVELLQKAAEFNWSNVRPEIFGTIFEHSLGKAARHASGAHFTNAADIMKIVGPTIVEPWRAAIEATKTLKEMQDLLSTMEHFTVLDPACGSGNFLYTAYRELKRLEASLYSRMAERFPKSVNALQRPFGFVTSRNFKGIDVNPFAIDIAKVTLMLAHKLAIDELHVNEQALPLDNLDSNFGVGDALLAEDGTRRAWPQADVIIGNPPFLGVKKMKPELGVDYVKRLRKAYPEIPGMAEYCVYWFRRAHDALSSPTTKEPLGGRAGLVGTQNIRNNASRVGGLDHIAATGTIVEAVENQPWSGEAVVHVSIANWVKTQDQSLLPKRRRLWFAVKNPGLMSGSSKRKSYGRSLYELDMREVTYINSGLSDKYDVSSASALAANEGFCFTGQYPRFNDGFIITPDQAEAFVKASPRNKDVVHPFAGGKELLGRGKAERFSIDFQDRSVLEAKSYSGPFAHVERLVLPYVKDLARAEGKSTGKAVGQDQGWLNSWWRFFRYRPELVNRIQQLDRYLVCSRITTRPIFLFLSARVRPSDSLSCFVLDDDYSFGILQSSVHYQWFHAKCSNMKSDPRYTSESVFDTFPWPQNPTRKAVQAVATAALEIRRIRADTMAHMKGGLRALYQTLDLPGHNPLREAHRNLDAAVTAVYGFSAKKDTLAQLLELNQVVLQTTNAGKKADGPGIPRSFPSPPGLITTDCLGL